MIKPYNKTATQKNILKIIISLYIINVFIILFKKHRTFKLSPCSLFLKLVCKYGSWKQSLWWICPGVIHNNVSVQSLRYLLMNRISYDSRRFSIHRFGLIPTINLIILATKTRRNIDYLVLNTLKLYKS